MKIKSVFLTAILTAVLCFSGNIFAYSGGNGEPNDPYQIADVNDLLFLAADVNNYDKNFILTADINLTGLTFTQSPIAPDTDVNSGLYQGTKFTGVFDGNNHIISNLTITTLNSYTGLFGYIYGGQIRNLGIEDVNINANYYAGGLAGLNGAGAIVTGCHTTGSVSGVGYVGGLIGANNYSSISNCYSDCNVTGNNNVGGLLGYQDNSTINYCHAEGIITGDSGSSLVGGLVGNNSGSLVSSSYSTGDVIGSFIVGGLIGTNSWGSGVFSCHATGNVSGFGRIGGGLVGDNSGELFLCHASGSVTATDSRAGGLAGINNNLITSCYATGSVTGPYNIGGLVGENTSWSTVTRSYAVGAVSGVYIIGGLVGFNQYAAGVISCYAAGPVSGTVDYSFQLGGLVGKNDGGVESSYSKGPVSGPNYSYYLGGLIGTNNNLVVNSFWDIETSNLGVGAGSGSSDGIYGRTSAEMKQQATFTDSPYNWDFLGETNNGTDDNWRMCADGVRYPKLTWEFVQYGDFECPDGVGYDDLQRLTNDWLLTYSARLHGADANGDYLVNFIDFAILANHWLESIEIYN